MTRLAYIFPFIAGCLHHGLTRLEFMKEMNSKPLFLHAAAISFWVALFSFLLCLLAYLVKVIFALWNGKLGKFFFKQKTLVKNFTTKAKQDNKISLSLLNWLAATSELLLVISGSLVKPKVTPVFLLGSLSIGLLCTTLAVDLAGWIWVKQKPPGDLSCAAACVVSFGILLLLIHPFSVSTMVTSVRPVFLLGFFAGISSCLTHVLTYKVIESTKSHWGGIFFCVTGQLLALSIINFFAGNVNIDSLHQYQTIIMDNSANFLLVLSTSLSRLLGISCVEFFGGVEFGYFTAVAPLISGQLTVSVLRDMTRGVSSSNSPDLIVEILPFSTYPFSGFLLVFVGSIFMWIGRWTQAFFESIPQRTCLRVTSIAESPSAFEMGFPDEAPLRNFSGRSDKLRLIEQSALTTLHKPSYYTYDTICSFREAPANQSSENTESLQLQGKNLFHSKSESNSSKSFQLSEHLYQFSMSLPYSAKASFSPLTTSKNIQSSLIRSEDFSRPIHSVSVHEDNALIPVENIFPQYVEQNYSS